MGCCSKHFQIPKREVDSRHPLHHPKGNHQSLGCNMKTGKLVWYIGWFVGLGAIAAIIYWFF